MNVDQYWKNNLNKELHIAGTFIYDYIRCNFLFGKDETFLL